jgi:hypothetical protein
MSETIRAAALPLRDYYFPIAQTLYFDDIEWYGSVHHYVPSSYYPTKTCMLPNSHSF